jgi:hypothetical protein
MQSPEEEIDGPALVLRLPPGRFGAIAREGLREVGDDRGGLAAQEFLDIGAFLLGQKVKSSRLSQEEVLVERRHRALQARGAGADPGLQHAMRRDDIGLARQCRPGVHGGAMKLPDAMDMDDIRLGPDQ